MSDHRAEAERLLASTVLPHAADSVERSSWRYVAALTHAVLALADALALADRLAAREDGDVIETVDGGRYVWYRSDEPYDAMGDYPPMTGDQG